MKWINQHSSHVKLRDIIGLILVCFMFCLTGASSAKVASQQVSVIDKAALTFTSGPKTKFSTIIHGRTHSQSPHTTYKGYQYATYYDKDRQICIARRKLPSKKWQVIHFTDYKITSNDSHNTAVLGICKKDGTIHMAFDHHVSSLHYRVSVQGAAANPDKIKWNASLFGPVTDRLGSIGPIDKVTYPRFIPAPNGNLMLYYRYITSANGDGVVQEYNGTSHDWTPGLGAFISRQDGRYKGTITKDSPNRCPYLNGISYGGNRLHVTWCWREIPTRARHNHDLCYAWSDDHGRTWHNNAGKVIGKTGVKLIDLNSPGLVVASIPQGTGLTNQNTHYVYPDNSVHVMVLKNSSALRERVYHHYWRNAAGVWSNETLPFGGSRPKLVGNPNHILYLVYTDNDTLKIAKGTPNPKLTNWSWSPVYSQSNLKSGGEGLIDYERWQLEGVLSVFDQLSPSKTLRQKDDRLDGIPSPLLVQDFNISGKKN